MTESLNSESQRSETARKVGCLACHKTEGKLVGPAFSWISYKYKGNKENGKDAIIDTIVNGSKGKWAIAWGIIMPPMKAQTTEEQRNELADYILGLHPIAPPE